LCLSLTIIPLALFGYNNFNEISDLGAFSSAKLAEMGNIAIEDSTTAINELGENMIQQRAEDVAKQLEIYIRENPTLTVSDLQEDDYFKSLAVQSVGKTGYTAITDVDSLHCRFHASSNIINLDLHNLAEKLPGFWGVMVKSEGGRAVSGYYDWAEPDGSIKQKYMHIAIVNARTADDVQFSVAATTYIDEFSAPMKDIESTLTKSYASTVSTVTNTTELIKSKSIIFILVVAIIAVISAYVFAKSMTRPLKKLSNAAVSVAEGNLDVEVPQIKSNDEIQDLSETFNMLIGAIKYMKESKENKK
jgi:methyl-accepting chemotaxis protein